MTMIQAQPKSSMGPRVLTVGDWRVLAGASDDSLSPGQGTEVARISGRLRLAFQARRDRTVDAPLTANLRTV